MENKRLKVGLFIDSFFPMVDGVIMVVDNYARRLSQFCDVTVFTLKPKEKKKVPRSFPYKVVQCKSIKMPYGDYDLPLPKLDRHFKKALKESKLDIVHIHSPFAIGKIGVKYAKKHNIPAVATMHSQFKQDFMRATHSKLLTKFMLHKIMKVFNSCDEYYGVNKQISQIFKEYGANHLPLVQRNGTDMTPVSDEKKATELVNKTYKIPTNTPVFLFVGRINKLKNIFFILEALEKLKTKDFKMFFVGEGQDFEEFEKAVKTSSIKDNIILTGRITDRELLKSIYASAQLFLFPSKYDASSLVQIEAASQKTPTVFLKGSATSATVQDNINGFLADDSPEEFAQKIDEILADEKLYEKVKTGAVNDLYVTWDDCVKEIYEKYLHEINKKSKNKEGEKNESKRKKN